MGSDAHHPEERPAHVVAVPAFVLEAHPVTNAEFRRFEEIAACHQVSQNTVTTHVRSIYLKLGAQNRRQAISAARQCGLL